MSQMWELPQLSSSATFSGDEPRTILTLRHAIMQTNYRVTVTELGAHDAKSIPWAEATQWIRRDELPSLPLTGLARKILTRAGLLDPASR